MAESLETDEVNDAQAVKAMFRRFPVASLYDAAEKLLAATKIERMGGDEYRIVPDAPTILRTLELIVGQRAGLAGTRKPKELTTGKHSDKDTGGIRKPNTHATKPEIP